jgi:hypothetical protein
MVPGPHQVHTAPAFPRLAESSTAAKAVPPMPRLKTYIVEDSPVIRENLIAKL